LSSFVVPEWSGTGLCSGGSFQGPKLYWRPPRLKAASHSSTGTEFDAKAVPSFPTKHFSINEPQISGGHPFSDLERNQLTSQMANYDANRYRSLVLNANPCIRPFCGGGHPFPRPIIGSWRPPISQPRPQTALAA
jgi:hypothetical protein